MAGHPEDDRDAHGRCLGRHAAHRPPHARTRPCIISCPGYTAKVAGTEKRRERHPGHLLDLLWSAPSCRATPASTASCCESLIARHDVTCWLVNTGWTGGRYGEGHRMPIKVTRGAACRRHDGELDHGYAHRPAFRLCRSAAVKGVDPTILDPRDTWADPTAYDAAARKLVAMFVKNFAPSRTTWTRTSGTQARRWLWPRSRRFLNVFVCDADPLGLVALQPLLNTCTQLSDRRHRARDLSRGNSGSGADPKLRCSPPLQVLFQQSRPGRGPAASRFLPLNSCVISKIPPVDHG